jgi:DNA N-6-adenine-methyltransferase (Dam)
MTENKLLGKHRPSSEWYTPGNIWERVYNTFEADKTIFTDVCDPCPRLALGDGLAEDWTQHKFIYCNPPTPAAPWATKALETVRESKDTIIIFAAFSEAVLWQQNELLDYPVCWVRNRINWIDGNKLIKVKSNNEGCGSWEDDAIKIDGKLYIPNPNYLKPSKAPRNYNAFILLSNPNSNGTLEYYETERRFCKEFSDLGTIQLSRQVCNSCRK